MAIGEMVNENTRWASVFEKENWLNADVETRMQAYQALEHDMAAMEGRPERQIIFQPMQPGHNGSFSYADGCIHLNDRFILSNDGADRFQGMCTTMHEGRHAYQHDCSRGIVADPDKAYLENERGIKLSGDTAKYDPVSGKLQSVYISREETPFYSKYYCQPNELDARKFELEQMKSLSSRYGDDPAFNDFCDKKTGYMEESFREAEDIAKAEREAARLNCEEASRKWDSLDPSQKDAVLKDWQQDYKNWEDINKCFDGNDRLIPEKYGAYLSEQKAQNMFTPEELEGKLSHMPATP
ncbi:MAG: hypothetical protein II155_02785, partial [Clostridia bacterium]|nr:hypothetical protein [Clostridia bacterium]